MKRTLSSVSVFAAAAAVVLGATGCPQSKGDAAGGAASGDSLRIAVCGPYSGSSAASGEMLRTGAELKIEEINAAGGIDGKKVVMVPGDDRGDTTEAANVSRNIASDSTILAVVGHFNSNCSNAAKEEYNRKGVLQITPGSTNVSVCAGYPWTFRNLYRDDYQGPVLADYAKDALGAKKAAVLYDNDDYGKGLMERFKARAEEIGLEVLEPISYVRERTQDFKPLVEKVKDQGVDVIFVSGLYNEAALITKAARQDVGLDIPILGGDGVMNEKFLELAGEAAEGVYVTTPFLFEAAKDDPAAKAFFESYQKKYSKDPDTWAALTYDAVGMVLQAIDEVGPDREKIRDWFAKKTTPADAYEGITGPTYFDAEGDCFSKGAHVAVVRDGTFVAAEEQPAPPQGAE